MLKAAALEGLSDFCPVIRVGLGLRVQPKGAIEVRKRDRDFDRDAAAYKRLRKEGIQPRGVDKSAQLEASINHKTEAQLGRSLHKDEISAFNRELAPI